MLKRMGYAVGAAALGPSLLSEAWARGHGRPGSRPGASEPIWNYTGPENYQFAGIPVFYKGSVILNAAVQGTDTYATVFYAIDGQTLAIRWSQQFASTYLRTAVVARDVIYVGDVSSTLYALNADTGQLLWTRSYALTAVPPITTGGGVIFTSQDGHVYALDPGGNQVWSYFTGAPITDVSTPVVAAGLVFVRVGTSVYALNAATGAVAWTYNDPSMITVDGGSPGLSVGTGSVYYVLSGNGGPTVAAIDIGSGQKTWVSGPMSDGVSSPTYYNGAVYVTDGRARFWAWDATASQQLLWENSTPQSGNQGAQLFIDDEGTAYFSTGSENTAGAAAIYAVDLASHGQDILSFQPPGGAVVFGVETGVCYYYSPASIGGDLAIGAVNLGGIIHQFFAESELMADGYTSGGPGGVQASAPTYRTAVRLVDTRKNPRANKPVKIWASGPVTITSGGQSYAIDATSTGKSIWLQTDALGELSIVTVASGGLTTPALYLWGPFMGLSEAIVVYPDQDSLTKLANVQGSDLQSARAYDGSPLLTSGPTDLDHLASAIRSTMGGTKTLATATPSRYIAYPASTTNLAYQSSAGPTARQYVAPSPWSAVFSGGHVTFSLGATAAAPPGSVFSDFVDFVDNVVNGVRQVAQVAWSGVEQVVATIYDDLRNGYQFVVQSVEQAAQVVVAIFKAVAADIEKAIEWLSFVFDWSDILSIKDQLKSSAKDGIANLTQWTAKQIGGGGSVDQFFGDLASNVQLGVAAIKQLFGTSTLQSKQQNGNDPQDLYRKGGAKSYTKSRWIIEKYTTNGPQANVGGADKISNQDADPVLSIINPLVVQIGSAITNNSAFRSIPDDLNSLVGDFAQLATDPSQFVTNSFNDILDLLGDIVTGFIQFVGTVVDALLNALLKLLQLVLDLATAPIEIPVISDLYRTITNGSSLSVLDLCCLILAIPTTLVQKALSTKHAGVTDPGDARSSSPRVVVLNRNIGYLFAAATYTVLDPLSDFTESPLPMKFVYLATIVVLQGLNFPTDLATNSTNEYVFYAGLGFPIIMVAIDIKKTLSGDASWDQASPPIYGFYGLVMLCMSVILAAQDTRFLGTDDLFLLENIFSFIPSFAKPMVLGGEKGRAVVTAIDAVCDVTALGLASALDFLK